jgi:hypothetical protein
MLYYVYFLRNPDDKGIFYVGKGKGRRMYSHKIIAEQKNSHYSTNLHLYNKISKFLKEGKEIIYEKIFESSNEQETLNKEIFYISQFGTFYRVEGVKKGKLLNLTKGGEGTSGYKLSEATKKRMSNSKLGKKRSPFSEETIAKMRLNATGKPGYWKNKKLSEKTKEKMSDIKKGKTFTESHKKSVSESLSGKIFTQSHRDALSKGHKGKTPWNKGIKTGQIPWNKK